MASKHPPPPAVEPTDEKPTIISHIDDKSEIGTEKHASAAADYTGAERKSDPEEIALVRKIDWRLMVHSPPPTPPYTLALLACQCQRTKKNEKANSQPGKQPTLMVMYFLNYVDRNAIAQARLNNLEEDLGMTGVQFNTCVSM